MSVATETSNGMKIVVLFYMANGTLRPSQTQNSKTASFATLFQVQKAGLHQAAGDIFMTLNQTTGFVSELAYTGDSKFADKAALMLSSGDSIIYGLEIKEVKLV